MEIRLFVDSEACSSRPLEFNGAIIERDPKGSIHMSVPELGAQIKKLTTQYEHQKDPDAAITARDVQPYQ